MANNNLPKVKVADYINHQLAICGRPQKEVAEMLGYDKPNVITMFKQGKTKLPINKVGKMAEALNVDPVFLLRLVMNEYMPETYAAIDDLIGKSLVSENEREILNALRKETNDTDPIIDTPAKKRALKRFADELVGKPKASEVSADEEEAALSELK